MDTYNCPLHNRTVQNCFSSWWLKLCTITALVLRWTFCTILLIDPGLVFARSWARFHLFLSFTICLKKKKKATDFHWKGKWSQSITSGCIRFVFLSVADVSNRFQPFRFYWTSWFQKVLLDKGRAHLLCSSFLWRCRHINISVLSLTICRSWIDDINNENAIKQTSLCIIFHVLGWSYTFLHAY